MKHHIALLTTTLALITAQTIYPTTMIVTTVSEADDIVYAHNANGDVFAWYGVEEWEPGDLAAVIMYDNATATIYDDVVLGVRYAGTTGQLELQLDEEVR